MKTRNYNEERLTRRLLITMLEADRPLTVEELSKGANITTPHEEVRFHHTLVCLRYNTWVEDRGPIWQLTEGGKEFAEWCRNYPQRARRLKQDNIHPVVGKKKAS